MQTWLINLVLFNWFKELNGADNAEEEEEEEAPKPEVRFLGKLADELCLFGGAIVVVFALVELVMFKCVDALADDDDVDVDEVISKKFLND